MRWLSVVALMLYVSLLVAPQVTSAHAPHLIPLADSQLQAISPLTGQTSLASEQETGDDNDNSLPPTASQTTLLLNCAVGDLPTAINLHQVKTAHPVRAPPLYS
tara:strand:- start:9403 stop:9714 length:312 start_codon:yes stop_codon:yes gene_type:complete